MSAALRSATQAFEPLALETCNPGARGRAADRGAAEHASTGSCANGGATEFASSTERSPVAPSQVQALRLIFALSLDRTGAAQCLGTDPELAVSQWPSTLYHVLATAALTSPAVWQRCQGHVDAALKPYARRFEHRAPVELARAFAQGREACSGPELAGLLWALVRRRNGATAAIAERLAAELEMVAARRLARPLSETQERTSPLPHIRRWNSDHDGIHG